MTKIAEDARIRRIGADLATQLRDYLRDAAFPGATPEEVGRRLGLSSLVSNAPWFADILGICAGGGLDLGIVVKDRGGNEVTFWPAENFSQEPPTLRVAPREIPERGTGFRGPVKRPGHHSQR